MTDARDKLIHALAAGGFVFIAFAAPTLAGELSKQQIFDSLTTTREREAIAAMADERPSVDLQIFFDFNSAAIAPQAVPQLTKLGNALAKPELKGSLVTISGHTDAKGSDSYNQKLSERRAESVKRYLVDNFRLSSENLVTVGFGKQKPRNTADLFSPDNRQVQVVNLDPQMQAQR